MATKTRRLKTLVYVLFVLEALSLPAGAREPYNPQPGSADRKVIMDTLRAGLKTFPDSSGPDFSYKREDIKQPADMPLRFVVHHLKIKEPWAWAEVDVVDYCCAPLYALLRKEESGWQIQGLMNALYVICPEYGDHGRVVQKFVYGEFQRKFPSVPKDVFPEIHAELSTVLKDIEKHMGLDGSFVYFVRFFKSKEGWAWVRAEPRSHDARSLLEPLECLVHKEKDRWVVKAVTPCCGDCEADPDCAAGRYHRKVMRWFPQAPKEIFPQN